MGNLSSPALPHLIKCDYRQNSSDYRSDCHPKSRRNSPIKIKHCQKNRRQIRCSVKNPGISQPAQFICSCKKNSHQTGINSLNQISMKQPKIYGRNHYRSRKRQFPAKASICHSPKNKFLCKRNHNSGTDHLRPNRRLIQKF